MHMTERMVRLLERKAKEHKHNPDKLAILEPHWVGYITCSKQVLSLVALLCEKPAAIQSK